MPSNNKSRSREYTSRTDSNANRSLAQLLALSAILVLLVASGCASTNVDDSDPYKYNPNTGYPFIGGPFDHPRP